MNDLLNPGGSDVLHQLPMGRQDATIILINGGANMDKPFIQHYIDNPYIPGYARIVIDNVCKYIKEEDIKRLLLEDIESMKFFKIINEGEKQ